MSGLDTSSGLLAAATRSSGDIRSSGFSITNTYHIVTTPWVWSGLENEVFVLRVRVRARQCVKKNSRINVSCQNTTEKVQQRRRFSESPA